MSRPARCREATFHVPDARDAKHSRCARIRRALVADERTSCIRLWLFSQSSATSSVVEPAGSLGSLSAALRYATGSLILATPLMLRPLGDLNVCSCAGDALTVSGTCVGSPPSPLEMQTVRQVHRQVPRDKKHHRHPDASSEDMQATISNSSGETDVSQDMCQACRSCRRCQARAAVTESALSPSKTVHGSTWRFWGIYPVYGKGLHVRPCTRHAPGWGCEATGRAWR